MTLFVERAALIMSIQDLGRQGYQRFGMPVSGPMDWWAFRCANRLVGNPPDCACVEMGFTSSTITVESDAVLAACGGGYHLFRNEQEVPLWMAFFVKRGDRLRFSKCSGGNWVYLAASGGIPSPVWMGSRSVYPRAGLGRLLADGDKLPLSLMLDSTRLMAGSSVPQKARPVYTHDPLIHVIPGPHVDRFTPASLAAFWEQPFALSSKIDRMGYRLTGTTLLHNKGADILSQGLALGQIQVPADGQPIVMMPDHPTTGGYTSIGTVIRADLHLVAQAEPGKSEIHFTPITVSIAQQLLMDIHKKLKSALQMQEESWLDL
ncbi:MAG: biotin-dependent carboxyltransferase family protein [Chloroflexota bacterium]|nr:biotin-dependent carboxyltransferase family protein [Chloroflexota bacterium]